MPKYSGKIGIAVHELGNVPGVWEEKIVEKPIYKGDIKTVTRRWAPSTDQINDNVTFDTEISVVADQFLQQNFPAIRYITYKGNKWKVSSIRYEYPRLTLTLGGLYNVES